VLLAAPFAAAFAVSALSACAAPASAPAGSGLALRVVVKLVHPSEDRKAIADEATRRAGVAASYAAAVSTSMHALVLHCADAAACDAAMTRLRQASGVYEMVEVDGRKHRAVM
jgi:hypothetical protein